jgi:hypothetical protein
MYDDDSPFPTSYGQGTMGNYWSSTPYEKYAYSLGLNIQGVYASSYNDRTMRASIRCFQN